MNEGIPNLKTFSERKTSDKEYLGGGRYGDVYKVKYKTGEENPEKGKKGYKFFAKKEFKTFSEEASLAGFPMGRETTSGLETAKKSAVVHAQLKELGIPTWTTYRLSERGNSVLMSLKGTKDDTFLILPNNRKEIQGVESDYKKLKESKIDQIDNLESTIDHYIDVFTKLKKLLHIAENDAVGIAYDKNASKIEVLFADLDSVEVREPGRFDQYFQRENMGILKWHVIENIKSFIEEYMDDQNEKKREYLGIIQKKMNEVEQKKKEFPQDPSEKSQEERDAISKILTEKLGVQPSMTSSDRCESGAGNNVQKYEVEDRNDTRPRPRSFAYSYEELQREKEKWYKRFIFKFNTPDSLHTYEKEKWCMEKAAQMGMPTSKCLYVGEEGERAFLVLEYIEGKVGSESEINPEEIYRKLGEYAKVINSIPVNCYGEDLEKQGDGLKDNWKEVVDSNINDLFEDNFFVENKILTKEQTVRLKNRLGEMYVWKFTPTLCHGNLCPENTIVSPDKTIHTIDWGNAEGHRAPHFELADLSAWNTKHECIDAFMTGYGISQSELGKMQHDINTLVALRLLKYIKWSIQNKKDFRGQDFISESIRKLDQLE